MKNQIMLLAFYMTIISLIITVLIDFSFNLLYFLDTMFTLSLLLTLTGTIIYIFQSGFLHPFYVNTKYFFRKTNRTAQMADQLERKDNYRSITFTKLPFATPFMITGITSTIVTSFITIILY